MNSLAPHSPHAAAAVAALPRLSVAAPCYNEAESLPQLAAAMDRVRTALAGAYEVEFVLVNDGSTDNTWALLKKTFGGQNDVRLVAHPKNRGIAAAIRTAIEHARGPLVATIDADCTYDPCLIAQMAPLCTGSVDMVVASPYHPRGGVVGLGGWRLWLSKLASRLYRCVMRNKLHTYTSCFRVCRRQAVRELPATSDGFVGVVELLWQLDRHGGVIVEHPAVLRLRSTGQSKMRVVRTALAHLRLLVRAAWLAVFARRATASMVRTTAPVTLAQEQ